MPPYRIRGAKLEELRWPAAGAWGSNELRQRQRRESRRWTAAVLVGALIGWVGGFYAGLEMAG